MSFDAWNNQADQFDPAEFFAYQQAVKQASQAQLSKGSKKSKSKNVGGKRGAAPTAWISEGAGTAGALTGGAIGTAILPGIGTLLGAGIGGLAGGFSGKLAEDKLRDDEWDFKDASLEGAVSGVMGAGPIRTLGAAGAGIKAAAGRGAANAAADPLAAAGAAYTGKGMTSKVADGFQAASDSMRVKSFRLNPTQLSNYKGKHGEDVLETMKRYGITKPEDIEVKALQPRKAGYDEAIGALGDIPKATVMENLKATYTKLIASAVHDNITAGRKLKQQAATINKKYGATIPSRELNALKDDFDAVVGYTDKRMNPADYNLNKHAADAIRKTLNDTADARNLRNAQGQSLRELGLEISSLRDLNKIVNKQTELGRGAQTIRLTDGLGAGVGAGVGGAPGAAAGAAATHALNSPTGTRTIANGLGAVAGANRAVGGLYDKVGASPLGAGGRVAATGMLMGGMNGAVNGQASSLEDAMLSAEEGQLSNPSISSENTMQQMNTMMQSNTNMGQSYQNSDNMSSDSSGSVPYSKENMLADIQRDPKHTKDYIGLYKELSEIYNPAATKQKPLSAEASKVISNANSGLTSLQQLAAMIEQGGVPMGTVLPGRSKFGNAGANILGTANFDVAAKNITDVITRLRTGAALTESEEKFYKSQIPQAFDKPDVVQQKLQLFYELFESVSSRTGSAGTSLEDMLMSMQSQAEY